MSVDHHDFTITRTYPYTPSQVFDAWADPQKKALWFGDSPDFTDRVFSHDFRVGGRDHDAATHKGGVRSFFDSEYTNIVPNERIVYTYSMSLDDRPLSTSVTCVTFEPVEGGTLMTFTEHGVHLDGIDNGEMREAGTVEIIKGLDRALDTLYG